MKRSSSASSRASSAGTKTPAPLVSIELPGMKVAGHARARGLAVLTRGLIDAALNAGLNERAQILAVSLVSGQVGDLPTDQLSPSDLRAIAVALAQTLGAGNETALVRVAGVTLRLQSLDKPATATKLPRTRGSALEQRSAVEVSYRLAEEFNRSVAAKCEELPRDFAIRREALRSLHAASRAAIAKAFEPVLNEHATTMPQATYDEKRALAKWVNAELRELGLAIRCPKTGQPALLRGHPGGTPGVGRFHLEITDSNGIQRRTVTSVTLPRLSLLVDDLARAPYGERPPRSR